MERGVFAHLLPKLVGASPKVGNEYRKDQLLDVSVHLFHILFGPFAEYQKSPNPPSKQKN